MTKEDLLKEIEEYRNMPAGWDNESDKVTNPISLDYAKRFIQLFNGKTLPGISAATGDEVSVYWNTPMIYCNIHFSESGKVCIYYSSSNSEIKIGNLEFDTPLFNKLLEVVEILTLDFESTPEVTNRFLEISEIILHKDN
jgi:hypothetical protein